MTPPARAPTDTANAGLPDRPVAILFQPLERSAEDLAADLALLSAAERTRADAFRIEAVRRRFVAARAGLRRAVAARLGIDPRAIVLRDNPWGKPEPADPAMAARLSFNLSHSGELAAIALADGPAPPPVGVDIEAMRPLDDMAGMVRIAFHPREAAAWEALAAADRPADFYRRWTRKEAVMKAIGLGFQLAPRGFALEDVAPGQAVLAASADPRAPAGSIGIADLAVPVAGMAGAVALVGARPVPSIVPDGPDGAVSAR